MRWLERFDSRLVVAGEVALALLLGFVALGSRSFWLDESMSVTLTQVDWGAFAHELKVREANMSLYYVLLSWWTAIGDSEVATRSLSVISAAATIPIAYLLTKRLAGKRAALLAGMLLAINPMLVHYSQEARSYALTVLLVTTGVYLFVRGIQQPTWAVWLMYAVVAALSAYAHFFALLVPPAMVVTLLFVRPEAVPWKKLLGAGALMVGLLSLFFYLSASVDPEHGAWVVSNRVGAKFEPIRENRPVAGALLVAGLVVAVGAWLLVRRRFGVRLQSPEVWRWAVFAAWATVPLALTIVLALTYRPFFVVRYFVVCVPALLILAAMLIDRIRRPALAGVVAAVLVIASLAGVVRWYAAGQAEDWRGATAHVLREGTSEDGVLLYAPYVRIPFNVYLERSDAASDVPRPVYPADGWETSPLRFNESIPVNAADVESGAKSFRRIWVVLSHVELFGRSDPGYNALLAGLDAAGFEQTSSESFDGIEVRRFDLRAEA